MATIGADLAPTVGSNGGGIQSLKDFTDINKIANPADIAGLTGGVSGIASKFSDMGAKFKNPTAAASMLNGIEIPNVPKLNLATPSLSGMVSDLSPHLDAMTGTGNGPLGLPNITDFTQAASGGPHIDAMIAALESGISSAITEAITGINSMIASSSLLLTKAGIDITAPPAPSMGSIMGFATGLHKMGANTTGSGIGGVLKGMATDDKYGEAIKASLAEGKNNALMSANGISPPNFSGGNPFEGLPSAGSDNSLNGGATLLGGT